MNGTMEEPMDTSPDSVVNCKKVTEENSNTAVDQCENDNKTGKSYQLDNESSKGTNSNVEHAVNENSSDSVDHNNKCDTEISTKELSQENINNDNPINNHCSNSNESYAESVTSSHAKSDNNERQGMLSMDEKSKDGDSETNCIKTENTIEGESDDVDSEDDSTDEEGSILSGGEVIAADTVSINSDSDPECGDDTSQESQSKNDDIIILENDNRPESLNDDVLSPSSVIHEIPSDNDDCILTNDDKSNSNDKLNSNEKTNSKEKVQLRRSSRAIKRKKYDLENGNDESDIEEVEPEDPLNHKTKPIVINDTRHLVAMAAKQIKSNNKEPTVVIIDTNSKGSSGHGENSVSISNANAQSLYQSIVARGTTVTPVSSKPSASTESSPHTAQPSILPSLTDDMFVVEAPSFIVPYVYEKPSVKPFREFVDVLGKELETIRAKEEQEQLQKEKEAKEKREKETQVKKERGEEVEEPKEEPVAEDLNKTTETEEDQKKKKKAEKRERRKRRNDEDDASWDGESSSESEDETLSDDDDRTTVVIKDKADSIEEIKTITDLSPTKVTTGKSDNYFDCSLGKFFINIGLNLVQEYVQNDLLKQQNRKLYREKKAGLSTKATESSIASLKKNLEFSKENNVPFTQPQIKCEFCSFKTESMLAMSNHMETPHMKNNVYKCNFCAFEIRSPHDILYHMEAEHNVRGKLERAPAYHQCPNCPFEDNGKGKLARHQIACAKKYKPDLNLSPPIEWEPPAKIPKLTRARNTMVNSYQSVFSRQVSNSMARAPTIANLMAGASSYRPRGRSPLAAPRSAAVHGAPVVRGGVMIRHNAPPPVLMPNNYPVANNGKAKQPSISITPLPRQPQPAVQVHATQQSKGTFVICEICDGYIKDLEQLRNHMQWIHKVKIHPKMIYNRPPLNCQKCQFRFFTDQGLERHLLGSHGLVTSSMQEAANKGKDAGRCPVCGRVYQWKLLNHVARDHNLSLKPAHLSYKCTVCTATFGMYKQFENHVYSAHSVVAKRVMDKSKTSTPAKTNDSLPKPLKINDEITIISQPVKQTSSAKNK